MRRLFPLCRSLTGDGVRATFDVLEEEIPITRTEIPSGTRVFDWIVPDEWNIRDAYIAAADGTRVVDFRRSTLHVVSLQRAGAGDAPARGAARATAHAPRPTRRDPVPDLLLRAHLGLLPLAQPRCSSCEPGDYEVVIDSTLEPGPPHLCGARDRGRGRGEVLISTYVCHPSLANDNLSGIVGRHDARQAADGAAAAALLPLPVRARHDRPARLAAPRTTTALTGSSTG